MTIWPESDYAATIGAAITLKQEKSNEVIKKSLNKSMTPNFIMVAFWTVSWPLPVIFAALLKYILENNGNKDYHLIVFFCGSLLTRLLGAVKFGKTSRPFFLHKKRPPEGDQ